MEPKQYNKGGGILRGRHKPSYYILVTALCLIWGKTRRIYPFPKFMLWVAKQRFKFGRWDNLGREEVRSAYLEAREKVFKIDDLEVLEGELETKDISQTNQQLEYMTDEKEIAKAHELMNSIKEDGVEGEGELPFQLLTK